MGGAIGKIFFDAIRIVAERFMTDAFSSGGGRNEDERMPRNSGTIGDSVCMGGHKEDERMSRNGVGKFGNTVNMTGGKITGTRKIGDSVCMGGHKEDEHKEGPVDKIKNRTHGEGSHEHKEGHDGEKKNKKKNGT